MEFPAPGQSSPREIPATLFRSAETARSFCLLHRIPNPAVGVLLYRPTFSDVPDAVIRPVLRAPNFHSGIFFIIWASPSGRLCKFSSKLFRDQKFNGCFRLYSWLMSSGGFPTKIFRHLRHELVYLPKDVPPAVLWDDLWDAVRWIIPAVRYFHWGGGGNALRGIIKWWARFGTASQIKADNKV